MMAKWNQRHPPKDNERQNLMKKNKRKTHTERREKHIKGKARDSALTFLCSVPTLSSFSKPKQLTNQYQASQREMRRKRRKKKGKRKLREWETRIRVCSCSYSCCCCSRCMLRLLLDERIGRECAQRDDADEKTNSQQAATLQGSM